MASTKRSERRQSASPPAKNAVKNSRKSPVASAMRVRDRIRNRRTCACVINETHIVSEGPRNLNEMRSRRVCASVAPQTDDEFMRFEQEGQQILPGIPNDITLFVIFPRLPWFSMYILLLVSKTWKLAIQSRHVYSARVVALATAPFVLIEHFLTLEGPVIGMYSVRDKTFHMLPPIPNQEEGIPTSFKYMSLDGKVYVLGGGEDGSRMYVLDLAGHKQWEECASMTYGRRGFGCNVLDGKIYVCGGLSPEDVHILVPEVYDPKFNRWSPIKLMTQWRMNPQVTALKNKHELSVHGGDIYNPVYFDEDKKQANDGNSDYLLHQDVKAVYNPHGDYWSYDKPKRITYRPLGANHPNGIGFHTFDVDRRSWRHQLELSPTGTGHLEIQSSASLAVDNETFQLMSWSQTSIDKTNDSNSHFLIRIEGLIRRNVYQRGWQECPFPLGNDPRMSLVHL